MLSSVTRNQASGFYIEEGCNLFGTSTEQQIKSVTAPESDFTSKTKTRGRSKRVSRTRNDQGKAQKELVHMENQASVNEHVEVKKELAEVKDGFYSNPYNSNQLNHSHFNNYSQPTAKRRGRPKGSTNSSNKKPRKVKAQTKPKETKEVIDLTSDNEDLTKTENVQTEKGTNIDASAEKQESLWSPMSSTSYIDITSEAEDLAEVKEPVTNRRLTWEEKGKDVLKKCTDGNASYSTARNKIIHSTSISSKSIAGPSAASTTWNEPMAIAPRPLPTLSSDPVEIKYLALGEHAIWHDAPATFMPRGPIYQHIDDNNMPNERCYCIVGIVGRSYLSKIWTSLEEQDMPPASVLQSIEIDIRADVDKYHDPLNETKIPHPFKARTKEVIDKHIQQGFETSQRAPKGTALNPNYRLPFTEEGYVRINTDSIFIFGPPNFGPHPTELEQKAIRQGMAYRYPGGIDKNIAITDKDGNCLDRDDIKAGDLCMVEYLNRPYNFTGTNGNIVQGHKLKLMSITRIKRRARDVVVPIRSRGIARATRAPRIAF